MSELLPFPLLDFIPVVFLIAAIVFAALALKKGSGVFLLVTLIGTFIGAVLYIWLHAENSVLLEAICNLFNISTEIVEEAAII